ncbi:hypothetical protein T08_16219 [Trichinella sp. T8]|nr:hypothetical protein T08_16219 [Trichinella sp. T8]
MQRTTSRACACAAAADLSAMKLKAVRKAEEMRLMTMDVKTPSTKREKLALLKCGGIDLPSQLELRWILFCQYVAAIDRPPSRLCLDEKYLPGRVVLF